MAKIYYRRYRERIDNGEITLEEAIILAGYEVPVKWRAAVIQLLENDRPVDRGAEEAEGAEQEEAEGQAGAETAGAETDGQGGKEENGETGNHDGAEGNGETAGQVGSEGAGDMR